MVAELVRIVGSPVVLLANLLAFLSKPVLPAEQIARRDDLKLAPAVGFEPTTNRLTADRSTTELRWIFSLAVAERESCPRDMRRQVRIG